MSFTATVSRPQSRRAPPGRAAELPRERTRLVVRPSRVVVQAFEEEDSPFGALARWGDQVSLLRPGAEWFLARWACDNGLKISDDKTWAAARTQFPGAFSSLRGGRMFESSLNLPLGEVMFKVTVEPVVLPEDPPESVIRAMLRYIAVHPASTFYVLEPFFEAKDVKFTRPLLAPAARKLEETSRARVEFLTRRAWPLFTVRRWWDRTVWAGDKGLDLFCAGVNYILGGIGAVRDTIERASIRAQTVGANLLEERQLRHLETRAFALGMPQELARIRLYLPRDPLLAFVLPRDPKLLRFLAHWYWVGKGKERKLELRV